MKRNILAIGAYERDNFGDYLFLYMLNKLLPDDNIITGSIIESNMVNAYGITTLPFDYVLSEYKLDAVWCVGGEIGGVDTSTALAMSLNDTNINNVYNNIKNDRRIKEYIQKIYGANTYTPIAYIPELSNYPMNRDTPLIVNSVGLSRNPDSQLYFDIFKKVNFLSVRDSHSLAWVNKAKIENVRLAPDIVSCISEVYTPNKLENVGLLLHMNAAYINNFGLNNVIKEIVNISYKYNKITLVMAGLAKHHDDIDHYIEIANFFKKTKKNIDFVEARDPLIIVDYIASADIVISTSLHMAIVASSYCRPRLSLKNEKVTQYIETWDDGKTCNLDISDCLQTIEYINQRNNINTYKNYSKIKNIARMNFNYACKNIAINKKYHMIDATTLYKNLAKYRERNINYVLFEINELINEKTNQVNSLIEINSKLKYKVKKLEYDISIKNKEIKQLFDNTKKMERSLSWKLTRPLRSLKYRIKKM